MRLSFLRGIFALAALASFVLPVGAAPAISNGNFSGTSGWTSFGVGAGDSSFGSISSPITSPSVSGGATTAGLIVVDGVSGTGINRTALQSLVSGLDTLPAPVPTTFMNGFTNTAHLAGVYQVFETATAGTISLGVEYFRQGGGGGDPFVFLYNLDSGQYMTLRGVGGTTTVGDGPNYFSNLAGSNASAVLRGTSTSAATGLPSALTQSYGERAVTLGNFAAGRYVIGFGVGAADTNLGNIGLAVTNIQSPPGVPEIDATTAALPVGIVLLSLMVAVDRRRAGQELMV